MNDSSDMSIAHLLAISMDNVKAGFDLAENKFNVVIEQRDAAIARAEKAEEELKAIKDWLREYKGPGIGDMKLMIRGNDRGGHSDLIESALKDIDELQKWVDRGMKFFATTPEPTEENVNA